MISFGASSDDQEQVIGTILSSSLDVKIQNVQYKNNLIDQDDSVDSESEEIQNGEGDQQQKDDGGIQIEITNSKNQYQYQNSQNYDNDITPLPMMKLLAIFIIMLCDAINSLSIFPYVNFLVSSFNLTDDKNKLGYFVGILASSYYIAQLVSSFFWGWFSNYKGRRPSLLFGLIGSMICLAGVGFSGNYPMVIIFRFLSGLLNGNVSIAKTMLGEITDSSNQAKAFSAIGLSWGVGGIVAPLIGGFFSNMCVKHPNSFDESNILCQFPYLLPNFICILFSLAGLLLGYFFLQESKTFSYSKIPSTGSNNLKSNGKKIKSSLQKLLKKTDSVLKSNKYKQPLNNDDDNDDKGFIHNIDIDDGSENIKTDNGKPQQEVNIKVGCATITAKKEINSIPITIKEIEEELEEIQEDLSELPRPLSELYKDKPVIYSCLTYACLGFLFTIFEEVFPNWSPVKRIYDPISGITTGGGLGFSSSNIGTVQSSAGIFALLIQFFVFPRLVGYFGLLKSYRMALLIAIPTWIILPELSRFCITSVIGGVDGNELDDIIVNHPTIFWVFLFPVYMFQSFSSEITFITIIVMVSNSALPKDMALVNSIGMFMVSISRSIGPTIAGIFLAFSLSHSLPFPFDFHMVFYFLILITICLFIASFKLPESLNFDKQKSVLLERIKNGEISEDVLLNIKDKPLVH